MPQPVGWTGSSSAAHADPADIGLGNPMETSLHRQLKESRRTTAKAEAKIADREATIDSLRGKLYGAHSSVARLEDELARHTGMTNGVVVSREAVTLDAYDDLLVDLRDAPRVRPRESGATF